MNILPSAEFDQLQTLEMVGDIALRFFDEDGHQVEHEINERILGLTLEQITAIPRIVGVAGGPEKFEVIRAALRGKLIHVLITDIDDARRLLAESWPESYRDRTNYTLPFIQSSTKLTKICPPLLNEGGAKSLLCQRIVPKAWNMGTTARHWIWQRAVKCPWKN